MQVLYLPGFASGPSSTKAQAFADLYAKQGIVVERLDLRRPSFEHLRLTAMIDYVRSVIHGPAVLIGSSLGGLTAARVAERDDRVKALVLLAPAFHLVDRWREQLGPEWDEWKRTGWREVHDYTTGGTAKVDFGFMEDAIELYKTLIKLPIPALILHGRNDATVPIEHSRTFASNKPNVTVVELDDGHQMLDSIPTVLAETERFLAPFLKS
jgi:pimeloyl-ACP methyl ester carboxylesterase